MTQINHDQVAQFLKDHPDFFDAHTDLLNALSVPHPYSGQAISIGERQVLLLRDRARNLEVKLREFIDFAEENDAIGEKLHRLGLGLMRARSLEAALAALYLSMREDFAVPHVALRLWPEAAGLPELPELAAVGADTRAFGDRLTRPLCGQEAPEAVRAWFGETGGHLRSFALAPLREPNAAGLLALASEDVKRFYPEMGTLYLSWLAELAGAAVGRFLP